MDLGRVLEVLGREGWSLQLVHCPGAGRKASALLSHQCDRCHLQHGTQHPHVCFLTSGESHGFHGQANSEVYEPVLSALSITPATARQMGETLMPR